VQFEYTGTTYQWNLFIKKNFYVTFLE
jgi:hypothetical protein